MYSDASAYPNIEWRPVLGFEEYYLVSNTGLIWTIRRKRLLSPTPARYLTVSLGNGRGGIKRNTNVHQLVAEAFVPNPFVPNPFGLPVVDHKDSNTANNHASNLQWVTHAVNVRLSIERGNRKQMGTDNVKAVLAEADVLAIRTAYIPGSRQGFGQRMAIKYNVQPAAISKIVKRRTWKHI